MIRDSFGTAASGSGKNRKADRSMRLPAGDYRLHYQSDESHAYMQWNDAAPDHLIWGIHIKLQWWAHP